MRTWRTDLALNYPGAPQRALVHGGFLTSYNSSALAANVTAAVARLRARHPGAPVYVSGHRCARRAAAAAGQRWSGSEGLDCVNAAWPHAAPCCLASSTPAALPPAAWAARWPRCARWT